MKSVTEIRSEVSCAKFSILCSEEVDKATLCEVGTLRRIASRLFVCRNVEYFSVCSLMNACENGDSAVEL
jgi:hypothetical protein